MTLSPSKFKVGDRVRWIGGGDKTLGTVYAEDGRLLVRVDHTPPSGLGPRWWDEVTELVTLKAPWILNRQAGLTGFAPGDRVQHPLLASTGTIVRVKNLNCTKGLCREPHILRDRNAVIADGNGDLLCVQPDAPHVGPWWQAAKAILKKEVIYVAHPVSGDPIGNSFKAIQWIKWLHEHDPSRVYVAPWVPEVLAFLPGGPSLTPADCAGKKLDPQGKAGTWERALADDVEVLSRFDGVILVGGRISGGMARERDEALKLGKSVTDMSRFASPADLPKGFFLDEAPGWPVNA